jgi:hypothetical protein
MHYVKHELNFIMKLNIPRSQGVGGQGVITTLGNLLLLWKLSNCDYKKWIKIVLILVSIHT